MRKRLGSLPVEAAANVGERHALDAVKTDEEQIPRIQLIENDLVCPEAVTQAKILILRPGVVLKFNLILLARLEGVEIPASDCGEIAD